MKILHIVDGYGGNPRERVLPGEGSVPSVVYHLAKHTAESGHDVTILERDFKELPKTDKIDGINYLRISAEGLPASPYQLIKHPIWLAKLIEDSINIARKINGVLKINDFSVVHAHFPFAINILISLNRELREKVVYTAHVGEERMRFNLNGSTPLPLKVFLPDLHLIKRVRKSVILSEALRNKLVKQGICEDRIEVIHNGVDVERFNLNKAEVERVKEKYGLDTTTVMFAGTITPRKGVEYLIKAGEILKDDSVLFLIVGNTELDEAYAKNIMERAKRRGVNAKFTGFVHYEDLKALYSACDIFVLPSLGEGSSIVLNEAMASGKPLIGTNVGGSPMQIKDKWNGFLVEPANAIQLAEKIKYLLSHPQQREIMGKNSRKLAEERFDWRRISERYLKIYEDVANGCLNHTDG